MAQAVVSPGAPAKATVAEPIAHPPPQAEQVEQTEAPRKPIATYLSKRTTVVYAEPAYGTTMRGRIDPDHAFHVYAKTPEGIDCEGEGWAEVAAGGYVCLQRANEVAATPVVQLPALLEGRNTPFIYGRPKQTRDGVLEAQVPIYRRKWAFYNQREPIGFLEANHQYAFVEQKRGRLGKYLIDEKERVVPAKDMQVFKPSTLQGRVLADDPVAEGLRPAWSVRRRAEVYDRPDIERGKVVKRLDYHQQVDIRPESVRAKGEVFELIPGVGSDGGDGYILTADIRHYVPGPAREDAGGDEVWVDVDVEQQVLAVMVGNTTEFITLISSGSHKHPTPPGVYRIRYKLAHGKMESRDDAKPDEIYYVEEVPWVQYFHARYALHAAFWHNTFGRRRSHGCINLAPADAAHVFSRTGPTLPPGFTSIHELSQDPGTVVRIRKGQEPVEDRRREFKNDGSEEETDDTPDEAELDADHTDDED